ncbi:MAG: hypothetical protein ACXWU2_06250 [Allosphingosinicella sp.]
MGNGEADAGPGRGRGPNDDHVEPARALLIGPDRRAAAAVDRQCGALLAAGLVGGPRRRLRRRQPIALLLVARAANDNFLVVGCRRTVEPQRLAQLGVLRRD